MHCLPPLVFCHIFFFFLINLLFIINILTVLTHSSPFPLRKWFQHFLNDARTNQSNSWVSYTSTYRIKASQITVFFFSLFQTENDLSSIHLCACNLRILQTEFFFECILFNLFSVQSRRSNKTICTAQIKMDRTRNWQG